MAVVFDKTSPDDCNLSWKVLKNGSSKNYFWILYCHSQINKSKTAVVGIIFGFATVRVE